MTPEQFSKANSELRNKSPLEIVRWAIALSHARAIVSTNFRPYEAVILHLCVQVQPDIPVLWVDHGYNRPATYHHAEQLRRLLKLNLKAYQPKITAAHRDAISGSYLGLVRLEVQFEKSPELLGVVISGGAVVAVIDPQHGDVRLHLHAEMENDGFVR